MLESRQLRRVASAPAELTSASSIADTQRLSTFDLVRQARDGQERDAGRKQQEVVASSSTSHPMDIIRNIESEHRNSGRLHDDSATAVRRDTGDSTAAQQVGANTGETVRQGAPVELDNNPGRVEAGTRGITSGEMRETIRQALRVEFERQNNRPPTLRERLNTDGNSVASYLGAAAGVIGVAGFAYTRWPNLIPH